MKREMRQNSVAYLGVCISVALILSYVESLIPFYFGIPGVKLGLTNLIIVIMLYQTGEKQAFMVSILRILLAGLLFGNLFSILYSLAGGILSLFMMAVWKRTGWFHIVSISVIGGITHNIAQLIVASLIVQTFHILYYGPMLLIAGVVTGLLIGILAQEMVLRLDKIS